MEPSIQHALEKATSPSTRLKLIFPTQTVAEPGATYPKQDMQKTPRVYYKATPGQKYITIGIDIDAPFPSFNKLGPIHHWMQHDLSASDTPDPDGLVELTTSAHPIVDYIGPAPPWPSAAHRYLFILYAQPTGFEPTKYGKTDGSHTGNYARMWYDLSKVEKEAGLGEVVASNWFYSAP